MSLYIIIISSVFSVLFVPSLHSYYFLENFYSFTLFQQVTVNTLFNSSHSYTDSTTTSTDCHLMHYGWLTVTM